MTPQVEKALAEARQQLASMYGDRLRRVVLFGSQARGDAGPESDADVLVVLDGPVDVYRETRRLADVSVPLLLRHGCFISLKPYDAAHYASRETPLMQNVRAEGVEL